MIDVRPSEHSGFFATLVRDPANWKAAAACIAGIAFAAVIMRAPEPATPRDADIAQAAAPLEGERAAGPVNEPAQSSDPASSTASACAERSWPYVDQRCDESGGSADTHRQVRVISTDKTAPASIMSKPPVIAAPLPQAEPKAAAAEAREPAKSEGATPANNPSEMFGSSAPAAIAALRAPATGQQPAELQPAASGPEPQPAAVPPANEPQPSGKSQRAASEKPDKATDKADRAYDKKRTRTAERPRQTREAVRMDGDRNIEAGSVVEERTYEYSDGRTVVERRIYRNGRRGELTAQDDRSMTRRVPVLSTEPVGTSDSESDVSFSRIY